MNLGQALLYFLGEAIVNLRRGWRTSLFAVLTIATSLFVGGAFLLVGGNAGRLVEDWRGEARVILYLDEAVSSEDAEALRGEMASQPAVEGVSYVSGDEARTRFGEYFPRMLEVLGETEDFALPASLEIRFGAEPEIDRRGWLEIWEADPRIDSVDDDVEWLGRLDRALGLARLGAVALWLVLAAGTMITIASLVRLSAFAYREEIEIMRLVGATEFVIRAPFYVEGILQGLLGGGLAVAGLRVAHALASEAPSLALGEALFGEFLSPQLCLALVTAGALAGLVGALLSISGENNP